MEGNGVLFPGKSDVEKLADSLKDGDESDSSSSTTGTIPKQPTYSDINKYVKNLNMLVGTGFVLLHNDLEELIKVNGGGGAGGGDWKLALVAAIAAAIPGVLEAVTEGLTSIIGTLGDKINESMNTLGDNIEKVIKAFKSDQNIDFILEDEELNQEILADEDIREMRKGFTKGYLKAYYSNLIANFGYDYDYKTDELTERTSVGSVVSDVSGGLASGLAEGIVKVYDGIAQSMSGHELDDEEDIKKIRKLGYKSYIRAYYANLMQPFGWAPDDINSDDWTLVAKNFDLTELGDNLGQALGGIVSGALGAIINSIGDSAANISLNNDEEVLAVRKIGYKAYLRAYYANLMQPFGWEPKDINSDNWTLKESNYDVTQMGDDIGQAIGGVVSGALEAIIGTLTNDAANIALNGDEEVKSVRKIGYKAYLRAYYSNLMQPLGWKPKDINSDNWTLEENGYDITQLGDDVGQAIGGVVSGALEAVVGTLTNETANALLNGDEEVKSTRKKGYMAYLKAYYSNMLEPYGYHVKDINSDWTLVENENYSWQEFFNDFADIISEFIKSGFSAVTRSITDGMGDASVNDDEEIKAVRRKGYGAYLKLYYMNLLQAFGYTVDVDNLNKGDFTFREAGFGEGKVEGWFNQFWDTADALFGGSTPNVEFTTALDDTDLNSDDEIKEIRKSGYKAVLTQLYERIETTVKGFWTGASNDLYEILQGTYIQDNNNQGLVRYWANNTKFDDSGLNNLSEVKSVRIEKYKSLLGTLYDKMSSAINNLGNKDDDVKKYAKSALQNLSNALSDSSYGQIQTTIVNEAKDYTDKLNTIMEYLLTIKNSNLSLSSIQENVEGMASSVETIANKPTGTYGASSMGSSFEGTPSTSGGN